MVDAAFWAQIEAQLRQLRDAKTADDVIAVLNPAPLATGAGVGDAFFAGSGGDGSVEGALTEAGWRTTWREAHYYWVMQAPNGDKITYVEGDIYRGDQAIR